MTPEVANHLLILAKMRSFELARQHVMASNLPGREDAVAKIVAEIRVNDAAMDALRPMTATKSSEPTLSQHVFELGVAMNKAAAMGLGLPVKL